MEFVPHDPISAGYALQQTRPGETPSGGLLSAAMRQENDLINVAEAFARPAFPPDPEFNFSEAIRDDPYLLHHGDALAKAASQEELDFIRGRIARETQDKERLAAAGWGGVAAGMFAGVISPTAFIPLVGAAKGAKGVAQSFALAAAAAGVQEAALYGLQETRTEEEALIGFTAGTVIGGLLGTAARYASRSELDAMESDMASTQGVMTVHYTDEATGANKSLKFTTLDDAATTVDDLSAASARPRDVRIYKPGKISGAAISILAKLNPVTRILDNSVSPRARAWMSQLFSPVRLTNTAAKSGTMYDRSLTHHTHVADFISAYDRAYAQHVAGANVPDSKVLPGWLANVKSNLKMVPEGKMSIKEFDELTFDLVQTGKKHDDPAVMAAVEAQKAYYDKLNAVARDYSAQRKTIDGEDAAPIYEEIDFAEGNELQNYAHHVYNPTTVRENSEKFLQEFADAGEEMLQKSFASSHERYLKASDKLKREQELLGFSPEARDSALAANQEELAEIKAEFTYEIDLLKELNAKYREAGLESDDRLAKLEEAKASFRPEYAEAMQRKRDLERESSILRKHGAGASEKYAKLQADLDKLEALQLKQLERLVDLGAQLGKRLQNISKREAASDKKLASLWAQFEKARKANHAQDEKLRQFLWDNKLNPASRLHAKRPRAQEREIEKYIALGSFESYDPSEALSKISEQRTLAVARTKKLNSSRTLREEALTEKLEALEPEALAEKLEARREELAVARSELRENFMELWSSKGAGEIDLATGKADFSVQARDDAHALFARLVGRPNRVAGMEVLGAERGPELARTLNYVPYDVKKQYLIKNPERVIRSHNYHLGPDLELYRETGSVNGAKIFEDMEADFREALDNLAEATHISGGRPRNMTGADEAATAKMKPITPELRKKLNTQLVDAHASNMRDMTGVIDRFRHSRGFPENADGFGYRLGRVASNVNVFRYMGTVVPSSLAEMSRVVFKAGITRAFNDAYKPFFTDLARVKMTRQQAKYLGYALNSHLHNRTQAVFDVGENFGSRQSKPERAIELLANKTGLVALFDRFTDEGQMLTSNFLFAEVSRSLKTIYSGGSAKELAQAKKFLSDAGVDEGTARQLWEQYQKPGGSTEFKDGVILPNTEAWTDTNLVTTLGALMQKHVNDAIIMPGLDRPLWMDKNQAFRLLAQFRSFTYTATNRILISGLQEQDMAFMQGAVISLALGMLSYYTWAVSSGGRAQETMEKADASVWIYEGLNRSGILAVLSEGQRIGEQIPGLNDYAIFGGEGRNSRQASSLMGAVAGPSFDLAERLSNVVLGMNEPTQSTLHNARVAIVPYQNVFYFRRLFDAVEESAADAFGIPERRSQ